MTAITDLIGKVKYLGTGSLVVIVITFFLFVFSLFTRGFTHELLLESAIFLVSVKLIIMTYRNSVGVAEIQKKLDLILTSEKHLEAMLSALRSMREEANGPAA